jgi:hypothetical protein
MAPDELQTVLSPLFSHELHAIWITENSFVSLLDDICVASISLSLRHTDEFYNLSIHAPTLEESIIICLHDLVGLQDTHFEEISFAYNDQTVEGLEYGERRLCPFGTNILEKILQNSQRQSNRIQPYDLHALATSGTKTNIEFYGREFQDEGAAFVKASAARQDETSGPAKLCYASNNCPFNDRNWALFLSQRRLDSLELRNIHFNSEVSCRAVASAGVRCLTLEYCNLDDEGAALVESVKQGRGPKELTFEYDHPFGSTESFVTFMNALRGDEHLERLQLPMIDNRQETRALAAALHEHKGLVHLTVNFRVLDDSGRTELVEAISLRPSHHWEDIDPEKRREFAKAVADMLSVNERVEAMSYDENISIETTGIHSLFQNLNAINIASSLLRSG